MCVIWNTDVGRVLKYSTSLPVGTQRMWDSVNREIFVLKILCEDLFVGRAMLRTFFKREIYIFCVLFL